MIRGRIVKEYDTGSQLGRFRDAFDRAGLRHGDLARVRVHNVRTRSPEVTTAAPGTTFFCDVSVEVLEILQLGDGNPIPKKMVGVSDLGNVPEVGTFSIEGIFHSNGRNTFRRTDGQPEARKSILDRAMQFAGLK